METARAQPCAIFFDPLLPPDRHVSAVPRPLTSQNADADDTPWVVCLCAQWCGTCRDYRPLFEEVARAHPALRFAWVDIEDHADIADDFDVETFPTILVASRGQGTRFLGPLLPNTQTLTRVLTALAPGQDAAPEVDTLLAAIERAPDQFQV